MRTFLILLFVAVAATFVVVGTHRGAAQSGERARRQSAAISSQRVARVYAQMADLEAAHTALKAQLVLASNAMARLSHDVDEEHATLEPLRARIRKMSAQEITYASHAKDVDASNARLQKALSASQAEVSELTRKLATAERAREQAVGDAEAARAKAEAEAKAQYRTDQEKLALADRIVEEVRVRNTTLQAAVDAAHEAMKAQAARAEALERELVALRAKQKATPAGAQP